MAIFNFLKLRKPTPEAQSRPVLPDGDSIHEALARLVGHEFRFESIIDLGASDGKWSRMAARYFPESHILGIEPLSERRGDLEKLGGTHHSFVYEICAAGNRDGASALLNVTSELDGSYIGAGEGAREVPMRTVDSLVAQFGLIGPFLLKFDTHGYEPQILEGAAKTLRDTPVIIMEMLNFGGVRFPELLSHLDVLGYRPLDVADVARTPTRKILWQFDFVLVRKDHPLLLAATYN